MHLPPDFFARVRDIRRRQAAGLGHRSEQVVRQWVGILMVGVVLLIGVVGYAAYRFDYWDDIESRVAGEPAQATYDKAAMERILKEFDERAVTVEKLLAESIVVESVATTSASTSAAISTTTTETVESN